MTPDLFAALSGLFGSTLIAATLFPAASEAVLVGLLVNDPDRAWLYVSVASAGNILGSIINWVFGRFLLRFQDRKWFPVSQKNLDRATGWYQRWGYWSLLLAWVPIIGDPITVAAGILRCRLWLFVLFVTIGKAGRYLVVAATTLHWMGL